MIKIAGPFIFARFSFKEDLWEFWYRPDLYNRHGLPQIGKLTEEHEWQIYFPGSSYKSESIDKVKEFYDNYLIDNGYKLVCNEEFQKLLILK